MKIKKIKSLPILLAFLMVLCILPVVPSKAAEKIQVYKFNIGSGAQNDYTYGQPATRSYLQAGTQSPYLNVMTKNMASGTRYNVRYEVYKGTALVDYGNKQNIAANGAASFNINYRFTEGKYTVKIILSSARYETTRYELSLMVYSSTSISYINGLDKGANNGSYALSAYTRAQKAYELSCGSISARQAAEYVITRSKMIGLSNTQYVDKLYNVLLDRNYDVAGRNYWIGELESGRKTRSGVLWGFLNSQEFKNNMTKRGFTW